MKIINYTIIILSTLILAWVVPMLYHLGVDKASKSNFIYYSSIEKDFCSVSYDKAKNKNIRKNINTDKEYSKTEFDSILPLYFHRQLSSEGKLPDSINGVFISPKLLRQKQLFFRNKPTNKNRPHIQLFTLFESMSGRVRLELPGDFFRLDNNIEFINPETNTVKKEKSEMFMNAFIKKGFTFPAKGVFGNPSVLKSYDEGYFIIDNKDQIFHLKMVNGTPFFRNTNMPIGIKPQFISVVEPNDKSFYAFVFDCDNKVYIISTTNYNFTEVPCPEYDINRDNLSIMANMLYWNISVTSTKGKTVFALDATNKVVVDSITIKSKSVKNNLTKYIFPFTIKLESYNTKYVKPSIKPGNYYAFMLNFFFMILYVGVNKFRKKEIKIISIIWVVITGIFGLIPSIVFNKA